MDDRGEDVGAPDAPGSSGSRRITGLVGVYDARAGFIGELRYAVARIAGRHHCSLCAVTHGGLRQKRAWMSLCAALPVPVRLVHLDQRTEVMRVASNGCAPCVLAEVDGRLVVLMDGADIDGCHGDVRVFGDRLSAAADAHDLVLG